MEPRWALLILILTLPFALALKKGKTAPQKKSTPREKYYIKSSECRIRNVQQMSTNATNNRQDADFRECYQDYDLISTRFHDKYQRYLLHINELLSQLIVGYSCSYLAIQRGTQIVRKEVPFRDGSVVPPEVEAMIASCSNSLGKVLQAKALTFVQPRSGARKAPKHRRHRKANVIMISMGAISRLNFRKNLPEMSKHLQMEGWYEMQGYGSVGQGLMPSLMAILSGYSPDTWKNMECQSQQFGCLDALPLIFDHFKRHGYLTAYGEDMSYQNPFAFATSSLDYYAQGMSTEMPSNCLGRLLNIRYVYEFWQQYLEQHLPMGPAQPLFGLFRTNSWNYDLFEGGNILEPFVMEYFQRFIELGLFKHSIVMLFSDGGGGLAESLLSMLFIWLPPWFRAKHPEAVQALKTNSQLLTSPYDLHLTLRHIVELGERWPQAVAELQDCPKCQTLLAPMNESRTCPDVGIGDATCPCNTYKPLGSRKTRQLPLGELLVRGINDYLHQRNLQELCSNLTLKAVTAVSVRVERQHPKSPHMDTYRVTFRAQPSRPEFAGTIRFDHKLQTMGDLNVGSIQRLDPYRKDSECMKKLTGKRFCVCKKPEEKPVHQLKALTAKHSIKKKAAKEKLQLKIAKRTKKKKYRAKRRPREPPRKNIAITKKQKPKKTGK